jgi:CheY-like chemotaxis protein
MDIQMPVMDGVTATRCIRALPNPLKDIPIIAMTGNVLPQQVRSFLDAGMNDHVGKPIERAKLYDSVRRWSPKTEAREASPFDMTKCHEFVALLGVSKTQWVATKFLDQLTDAFKSTPSRARFEAHGLINCAGRLGFQGLVDACLAIERASPDDDALQCATLDEARTAQATARQTLIDQILPKLRTMPPTARRASAAR